MGMFPRAAGLFTALAARRDSPRIREADYGKKERSSHDGYEREREREGDDGYVIDA